MSIRLSARSRRFLGECWVAGIWIESVGARAYRGRAIDRARLILVSRSRSAQPFPRSLPLGRTHPEFARGFSMKTRR